MLFPNEGDLTKVFPPEEELKDSYIYEGKHYGVRPAIGAWYLSSTCLGQNSTGFFIKIRRKIIRLMPIRMFILLKHRR